MSRVLSLALKITGDASGVRLTPVERALKRLGEETDKVGKVFDRFAKNTEAGQRAQAKFADDSQRLTEALKSGTINSREYAEQFARLAEAANAEAAALERAARITEASLTPLERFDRAQAELTEQLNAGRISQETYARATESAAKGLTDAERAARGFAVQQKEIDNAAANTTLKFNELSGVFSVLPGPLGNIAGRISGIASASEGLSRVFAGGLQAGFQGLVSSVTALINPLTLSLAGITAFAAGAAAVARGLVSLEDRVERLGRLANQLGVSFDFVQVLEEAGKRTDVSIEQLSGSFARLQNTLAGADEESKKAQAALQRLGVSVAEFGALSEQQRIELIGERLAQIEDPAQRSAAAIALFGRSGVQLLPFFNEIGLAATDMERFGRAVTDLDRQQLAEFGGSIDALSLAAQGLGQSVLLPFVGLGDGIARAAAEVTAGFTSIIDPIGRILEPLLTQVGRIVELIGVQLGNLGRVIGAVFEPFAVIVQEVATALEPLYEGFFNFLQGISNAAVAVAEWVISFTPVGAIAANVGALGDTISRVVTIITTAFQRAGEFVGGLVSRFSELVSQSPFLQALGDIISSVFGNVSSVFSTIANAIGGTVGRLLTLAEEFLGIDRSAQQAAAATEELAAQIEEISKKEAKLAEEREKFLQGFSANVSDAINESAKFGQAGFDAAFQYQTAIAELQKQFDKGILNEESFRQEAERASAAYTAQIDAIKAATAETEAIVKRVDGLLEKANELPKLQQDLNAVEAEIARVQAAVLAARTEGQTSQADALVARLAQLDQLQASLIAESEKQAELADEIAQGFDRGFDAAFDSVSDGIKTLTDNASRDFGDAGFQAALKLQEGIAAAREQVQDGIFNREAFEREVSRQEALFQKRVEDIEKERVAREAASKAAFQAEIDANNRVQEFLRGQFGQQVEADKQAVERRLLAAQNIIAIERQLVLEQQVLAAAREQGDLGAARAGVERVNALKQALQIENEIQQGRQKQIEQQKVLAEAVQKQAEQAQQAASQQQEAQKKAFEEQSRAAAAEADRQDRRIRALNSIGQQSIGVGDLRSTEGANTFLQAAAGAFDPRLAEARAQTKLLSRIAVNSGALQFLDRGIGSTFQFLGGGA